VQAKQKYEDLELLRGLAAVGVTIYHFNHGFMSAETASQAARSLGIVVEPPFVLGIFNGPFMVAIFFVLSSYSLTFRLLETRRPKAVLIAIAKRLPRLFPLAFVGALFAGLLQVAGLMFNREAAALTGSEWMSRTGGVKMGPGWDEPSLLGAALDGVVLFVNGFSQYNAALWTMGLELIGGILALITAALIAGSLRPVRDLVIAAALVIGGLYIHPLCAVCVGAVLVTKYLHHRPVRFSARIAVPLLILGVVIGSSYSVFEDVLEGGPFEAQADRLQWLLHGFAALIVFLGVHCWGRLRDRSWPVGRWLGRMSFSTYVLHMPVHASVGAGLIVLLGYSGLTTLVALAASMAVIFLLSIPLAAFDERWVKVVNRTAAKWTNRLPAERAKPVGSDAP